MKVFSVILTIIIVLLSVVPSELLSCQKWSEACWQASQCCGSPGRRIVCAPHQKICGKKNCCITEVEEQEEKQAAIIRDRNPPLKRLLDLLINGEEE